jgi:hypothetical protein
MNIENLKFDSAVELLELIRQINIKYYLPLTSNICFLEEYGDRIFLVYIITLKDAYSHLNRVFDYDVQTPLGRENARTHLILYSDHLQEGLMDTFRSSAEMQWKRVRESIPEKELKAIEIQVAQKTSELRIVGNDITIDQRIDGYKSLLDYFASIRKKFSLS